MQTDDVPTIAYSGLPVTEATHALILLHGRGGTADEILSLGEVIGDDSYHIAAPQAPGGSWYPHNFMVPDHLNEPYLSSSIQIVHTLIEKMAKHIPTDQICIVGFSQGACLALEVAGRYATRYLGVAAFTGGLIGHTLNPQHYRGDFAGTKIFIGTSDQDPHVPLVRVEQSKALLLKLGAEVTLKVYKGLGHTINEDEIHWVKSHLLLQDP